MLKNSNSSLQEIEKTVEEVTQESTQHLFKRRLLATRMHHQLTVLHKKEYMALLRELAY